MRVADAGPGIDSKTLPHIFEPFARGKRKLPQRGLGLGLSIAAHIVSLHAGSIAATGDGIGRGATFTIELPALGH